MTGILKRLADAGIDAAQVDPSNPCNDVANGPFNEELRDARPEGLIRGLRPLTLAGQRRIAALSVGRSRGLGSNRELLIGRPGPSKYKRPREGGLCILARPEGFEPPTPWFVAKKARSTYCFY